MFNFSAVVLKVILFDADFDFDTYLDGKKHPAQRLFTVDIVFRIPPTVIEMIGLVVKITKNNNKDLFEE